MRIILGSSSPRRKRLLRKEGIEFEILKPEIDESRFSSDDPIESVEEISIEKVNAVKSSLDQSAVIITADTLGEYYGEILGKPSSKKEAKKWLRNFSEDSLLIHTGYFVSNSERIKNKVETTKIKFRELSEEEIDGYVSKENVQDLAGGFNVEKGTKGENLISEIRGSYSNVMGLPLEKVIPLVEKFLEN